MCPLVERRRSSNGDGRGRGGPEPRRAAYGQDSGWSTGWGFRGWADRAWPGIARHQPLAGLAGRAREGADVREIRVQQHNDLVENTGGRTPDLVLAVAVEADPARAALEFPDLLLDGG